MRGAKPLAKHAVANLKARPVAVASFSLAIGLGAGALFGAAHAETAVAPAAYVIVSGRVIDQAGLEAYREAAGPLGAAAGLELLALGEGDGLHVLEGEWPFAGFVAVERFRSLGDLQDFWNSPAYQEAIGLRAGSVELDFVVALEATP